MSDTSTDPLANQEALDAYCAAVETALRGKYTAQMEFLQRGLERLGGLHRSAEALGDSETVAELSAHSAAAEAHMARLQRGLDALSTSS